MCIALLLDQRTLAHPHMGLAQPDPVLLGQAHQALAGAVHPVLDGDRRLGKTEMGSARGAPSTLSMAASCSSHRGRGRQHQADSAVCT
jgi:hypothetical protein